MSTHDIDTADGPVPGVTAALSAQRQGKVSAETLVNASLAVIEECDATVHAWECVRAGGACDEARQLDEARVAGREVAGLHGIAVGIKDIIDTADLPTANGTPIDTGRQPQQDAVLVQRLRAAGAIVLGKTVTTELAYLQPSVTHNPAAPGRTPGGSSSGSAAAVAAGMVPAAVGTQTGGSVIRPASFCGVVGYKPTFGAIPRTGVLMQSPSLDTVGVFTRSVEDAARVAEVMVGDDPGDADSLAVAPAGLVAAVSGAVETPRLAFARTPYWDQADEAYQRALYSLVDSLGDVVEERVLPPAWEDAAALRMLINNVEMARWFDRYLQQDAEALSEQCRSAMQAGRDVSAVAYIDAVDRQGLLREASDCLFDGVDAIICPAVTGAAPLGRSSTGNPIFNGLWTFTGVPAITLPLMQSADGAPMGVQLVSPRGDDARLLTAARWLESYA